MKKLIKISTLRKENNAKCKYVYKLMSEGKLTRYIENGYLAYDEYELEKHYKTSRVGRPIKGV